MDVLDVFLTSKETLENAGEMDVYHAELGDVEEAIRNKMIEFKIDSWNVMPQITKLRML